MSAYCARSKLAQSTVRFRFDGQPISENDTPRDLDMEDGDTIEVFQQQTGGLLLFVPTETNSSHCTLKNIKPDSHCCSSEPLINLHKSELYDIAVKLSYNSTEVSVGSIDSNQNKISSIKSSSFDKCCNIASQCGR